MIRPTVSVAKAAAPSVSSRGKETIGNLMKFLHLQAKLEANKPTYSRFLGLSASLSPPTEQKPCADGIKIETVKDVSPVRADRFSFLDASVSRSNSSGVDGGQQQQYYQQEEFLVFRYKFPVNDRLKYLPGDNGKTIATESGVLRSNSSPVSLSAYISILDEITTYNIISATGPKRPRPGVSVTMQSQWGPAHPSRNGSPASLEEVDVVTTITKKGRNLAFVRAEVRDPNNNDGVICYFDHVKYLSVNWMVGLVMSPMGMRFLDLFLRYVWPYLNNHGNSSMDNSNSSSSNTEPDHHSGIMDSFRQTSDVTATFRFGPDHTNGFGGLHGGFQAVLMERLGQAVARKELSKVADATGSNSSRNWVDVECQRLQVSYQSSASRHLELRAHVIDPPRPDRPSVTLRIEMLRGNGDSETNHRNSNSDDDDDDSNESPTSHKPRQGLKRVVVSEGILTFASASSKTKIQ
uniref:Thioesterase domain-containing protein n=1 Tax=Pseudo-nitzschia australis TaxID=44445 RepID=A0A7S4AQP0_9STRA|mmetsp:Transcript_17575/g.38407  ORF Transcript_17575/g.38407 Transcript_17575/m.38407 type:complete len:464 (-) Transcript_17575:1071-2462(-)